MHAGIRLTALGLMLGYGLAAAAAMAQSDAPPAKPKKDPNEWICRVEPVLGSRLAKTRMCMTRAQWAERRASDRALIERTQLIPCTPTRSSNCY